MTDKPRVAQRTVEVNNQNTPSKNNIIDFYSAPAVYGLAWPATDWGLYQRALWRQTKERRDEEQRLRLGLTKEAWAKELDRRLDFERPYPRPLGWKP